MNGTDIITYNSVLKLYTRQQDIPLYNTPNLAETVLVHTRQPPATHVKYYTTTYANEYYNVNI
jgi:hypothetical protein